MRKPFAREYKVSCAEVGIRKNIDGDMNRSRKAASHGNRVNLGRAFLYLALVLAVPMMLLALNKTAKAATTYTVKFMYSTNTPCQESGADLVVTGLSIGDTIDEPYPPVVPSGKISFRGWSLTDPATIVADGYYTRDKFWVLKNASAAVQASPTAISASADLADGLEDGVIFLYAVFSDKILISYLDDSTNTILQTDEVSNAGYSTFQGPNNETLTILSTSHPNQRILYWYEYGDTGQTPVVQGVIPTRDMILVPKWSSSYVVTFNTGGETNIQPQLVLAGGKAVAPNSVTRAGYTFKYWSTNKLATPDSESSDKFDFNTAINADTTLYAIWKGEAVAYTVVYWREIQGVVDANNEARASEPPANIADTFPGDPGDPINGDAYAANYEYVKQITITAGATTLGMKAGDSTKGWGSTDMQTALKTYTYGDANGAFPDYSYWGYVVAPPTIAGDGTTIINVYFPLKWYKLQFDIRSSANDVNNTAFENSNVANGNTTYKEANAYLEITLNGTTTTYQQSGATTLYSFYAKPGQNIEKFWPNFSDVKGASGVYVYGWRIGNSNEVSHTNRVFMPENYGKYAESDDTSSSATYANDGLSVLTIGPSWRSSPDTGTFKVSRLYYLEATAAQLKYIADNNITVSPFTQVNDDPLDGENFREYISYNGTTYVLNYKEKDGRATSLSSLSGVSIPGWTMQYNYSPNMGASPTSTYLHTGIDANKTKHYSVFGAGGTSSYNHAVNYTNIEYVYFLYSRTQSTIYYNDSASPQQTYSKAPIKYGESIASSKPSDPEKSGYMFLGWYTTASDQPDTKKVDFSNTTMPSGDMYVYAWWERADVKVEFYNHASYDSDGKPSALADYLGEGEDKYTAVGGTVSGPGAYVINTNYPGLGKFKGWVWLIKSGNELYPELYPISFEFGSTPVTNEVLYVFATWETAGYKVYYHPGVEGQWTDPSGIDIVKDDNSYMLYRTARVLPDGGKITADPGKVFYGWQSYVWTGTGSPNSTDYTDPGWTIQSDGVLSYPLNQHVMTGDTMMVAVYGELSESVRITYYPGITDITNTYDKVIDWRKQNESTNLRGAVFNSADRVLIGWATSKDLADAINNGTSADYNAIVTALEANTNVNSVTDVSKYPYITTSDGIQEIVGYFALGSPFTTPDMGFEEDDASNNYAGDIQLYGVWIGNKYRIVYKPDVGGKLKIGSVTKDPTESNTAPFVVNNISHGTYYSAAVTSISAYPILSDAEYNYAPIPVPDAGYEFDRWEPQIPSLNSPVTQSFVYTAKFKKIDDTEPEKPVPSKYCVDYYLVDGNTATLTQSDEFTALTGETVKASIHSFSGYTFDELAAGNILDGIVEGDGSLILRVFYKKNSSTPVGDGDDDTGGKGGSQTGGENDTGSTGNTGGTGKGTDNIPDTSDKSDIALWLVMFGLSTAYLLRETARKMRVRKIKRDRARMRYLDELSKKSGLL
jgi:uncharacterized repeat protein (TIGR02543 family)